MSGTIKGITIEIGGNTKPLEQALGDVNKKTRDLQGELKSVERLLKLDPGNTELLAQKQKLLAEQVENSADKLNRLKSAQEQVNQAFQKGDLGEEQYRHFQRQVINAEQDLKKFENQLKDVNTTAKKAGMDIKDVGDKMSGMGQKLSMGITAPIVGGFVAVTQGTKELRSDLATLSTNAQVAGQDMGVLNDAMVRLYAITGETDSNVEGLSELMATGFRDEQLTELLDSLYGAAVKFKDTMKFEGIADGLQETLATGAAVGPFGELLERSGIQLDGFNAGLQAAIKNGTEEQYVLDVLAKTGLAETYEAYRKNNDEMVKAEEANFRMQQAMAKLGATLEPILTPIIEGVTNLVNKFNEMDPAGQKIILTILGIAAAIGPLLMALGPIVSAIGALGAASAAGATGMAVLTTAFPVLGGVIAALTGPIGIVIAAIAAAIAIGVLLYKNWDEIKAKAIEIWTAIKEFFSQTWDGIKQTVSEKWSGIKDFFKQWGDEILLISIGPAGWAVLLGRKIAENWDSIKNTAGTVWGKIKEAILSPIRSAKETLLGIIDSIKNAFNNLKITIPTPKLPHVSVNWKSVGFGDAKVNIPDFDLNWYKTGGIFTQPAIIGVGEAGKEAVIPIDKLPGMIATALREALGVQSSDINMGSFPAQPIQLVVNLDGRIIAQGLYNVQRDTARGRGLR